MNTAFTCTDLTKRYKDFTLGPINLELEPGIVLGMVGPNGSGKSTLMHCIAGLVRPDSGSARIFGRTNHLNRPAWKLDIGYVGEDQVFYERWTGLENLRFTAQFYPAWSQERAESLAARFRLPLDKPAKSLSRGNRVKLSVVTSLAHSPRLLVLDEPTAGLDPVVRDELIDVIFEVMEDGNTAVFYSTHVMGDISRVADELVFISDGSIMLRTAKDDLTARWGNITFTMQKEMNMFDAAISHTYSGHDHRIVSADAEATMRQLQGIGAGNIRIARMSIEDIAVYLLRDDFVKTGTM